MRHRARRPRRLDDLPGVGDHEETAELVDILFEAGQLATVERSVRAVKYVGDGVFIAGRDAGRSPTRRSTRVDLIAERSPIPARAGFAYGMALRRAGDFFGMPMNLAQLLTKVADPGTVLATEDAAAMLPEQMVVRRRTAKVGPHAAREGLRDPP